MPFRLLHTADLLLDVPFIGVGPTPRPLFERLRDAPVATVDHLVGAALAHHVDAVLIAGGVSGGGPVSLRAATRLTRGVCQLADAGIPTVVVLGPREARAGLPASPGRDLPDAVTVVPPGEVVAVALERDGERVVAVVAASAPYGPDQVARAAGAVEGRPVVALATLPSGPPPPLDVEAGVAFWALGGAPEPRGGPVSGGGWAVVAAAPQPRVFPRPGPRPGAALLELGDGGPLPPTPLDIADLRLVSAEVDLARALTIGELEEQALAQLGPDDGRPVVAQLVVHGDGPGRQALGDPAARRWVLDRLQSNMGARAPGWWSDLVLVPLPAARRGALAQRSPGVAAVGARASEALRAGPGAVLDAARQRVGATDGGDGLPPPAAWAGIVHEAASLALDLVGAAHDGGAR
ncbi:MAG: hypothetical protein GEV08_25050 [Acidimicrobiia bacterium]|nr:hypothetical protein [Acidimicrobiia bacterium]